MPRRTSALFQRFAVSILVAVAWLVAAPAYGHSTERDSSATLLFVDSSGGADYDDIQAAVDAAVGPTEIHVGAGTYKPFTVVSKDDLAIVGSSNVIVSGNSYAAGAGVTIEDCQNVSVTGIRIERNLWGIVTRRSRGIDLAYLTVRDIGQEAISISDNSASVSVSNSLIGDTGKRPGTHGTLPYTTFGEGIYIGSSAPNPPDQTRDILVAHNEIFGTTAEAIDIKPNAHDVVVEHNEIHDIATSTSGAVVVGIGELDYPAANVTVRNNLIWNIKTTSPWSDGTAIHISAEAVVAGNVIWGTQHFGILLDHDFIGANQEVTVANNAVFDTGLAAIEAWPGDDPASVTLSGNLVGNDATQILGQDGAIADGTPSASIRSLATLLSDGQTSDLATITQPPSPLQTPAVPNNSTSSTSKDHTTTSATLSNDSSTTAADSSQPQATPPTTIKLIPTSATTLGPADTTLKQAARADEVEDQKVLPSTGPLRIAQEEQLAHPPPEVLMYEDPAHRSAGPDGTNNMLAGLSGESQSRGSGMVALWLAPFIGIMASFIRRSLADSMGPNQEPLP